MILLRDLDLSLGLTMALWFLYPLRLKRFLGLYIVMIPNIYAINIILMTIYLVLISAYIIRRRVKPEKIVDEVPRIARGLEKASKVRSKKKASVMGMRYRRLRGRVFRMTMITATIPIVMMLIVILYSYALFGELGLAAPGSCSLPPPIEIEISVEGKTSCYIYIVWITFLAYIMILPLYNRISGTDLLRRAGGNR